MRPARICARWPHGEVDVNLQTCQPETHCDMYYTSTSARCFPFSHSSLSTTTISEYNASIHPCRLSPRFSAFGH